jgi:hypothetical protein
MSIEECFEDGYKIMRVNGPNKPNVVRILRDLETRLRDVSHFWVSMFDKAIGDPMNSETRNTGGSYKLDNAAYLYFFKIFSNETYSAGKQCQELIQGFQDVDDARSASQRLLEIVDTVVETVVSNLSALQSPGEILQRDYLPRAKSCAERYIYSQLGDRVWKLYVAKFAENDAKFCGKRTLLRKLPVRILLDLVDVRKDFWPVVGVDPDALDALPTTVEEFMIEGHRSAFVRAAGSLTELRSKTNLPFSTPKEGLEAIVMTQTQLKAAVLQATNGQRELQAMDDQIPLFIFVLLASDLTCPFAVWNLLFDSLTENQRMESDGRIVALLETAACYVTFEAEYQTLHGTSESAETGEAPNGPGKDKDGRSDSSEENDEDIEVMTNGHGEHGAD